jgi:DNA-directed RNA polymerase subunit RPC12/RpoP
MTTIQSDQIYDPNETTKILRDYRCAACWGHLLSRPANGRRDMEVYCPICGGGRGMVFHRWVERQKQLSLGKALEVRYNLIGILPCLSGPKKSEKELVKDVSG